MIDTDNTNTLESFASQKFGITSLNQLSKLYGGKSPHEIAQSVVYGSKTKIQQSAIRVDTSSAVHAFTSPDESKCRSPPSKLTLLSQQLYNYLPQKLETGKSSRAFHNKEQHLLLSPERLRSIPSPMNRPMTDVTNRLVDFQCVVDRKKEDLKEKHDQQQMSLCTFKPQIDTKSRNMIKKVTELDVRSIQQFNEDQNKHVLIYQDKYEVALEKKATEEVLLLQEAPKLSLKTEKLAQLRQGNTNVVERLHCISMKQTLVSVSQDKQLDPMCSFHPEISNKSKNLKRLQPVNEFLFQDAQKRKEKQQQSFVEQSVTQSNSVKGSESSIGWFVQRFIKEFYHQLSGLDRIKQAEQKDYSRLTYSETLTVLQGLNYLKQVQYFNLEENNKQQLANLWQHLAPQDPPAPSVLSRNLLVVLLAILAVPTQYSQIPHYKPHQHHDEGANIGESDVIFQQSRAEFMQPDNEEKILNINKPLKSTKQLQRDKNGNINLSQGDSQYLYQTFYDLYLNSKQLAHGNSKRRQMARSPEIQKRGNTPLISQNSQQLSIQKRIQLYGTQKDFNINEWFELQENIKAQKRETVMLQVKENELKECNFGNGRAQQCTINLKEFSRPQQRMVDRKPQDIDFERQSYECTFQPKISNSKSQSHTQSGVQLQISKIADRLKEARVRKQALEQIKEKGSTTNNRSRGLVKRSAQNQENKSKQSNTKGPKSVPMNQNKKSKTEGSEQFELCSSRKNQEDEIELIKDIDERIPLLFVDVNIEEGKTARIIVFDGDKSDDLVDKFSLQYNLDDSMRLKLKELLDMQINNLLTKIDEDFCEENSEQEIQDH